MVLAIAFAFVCGFIMDLVWTWCIHAVTQHRPVTAANLSAILYLCTLVSTVLIVERCYLAVAAYIAGGWIGTYLIVANKGHWNVRWKGKK